MQMVISLRKKQNQYKIRKIVKFKLSDGTIRIIRPMKKVAVVDSDLSRLLLLITGPSYKTECDPWFPVRPA